MKLSDLLGSPVLASDDEPVGRLADVVLDHHVDGPGPPWMEIVGLITTQRSVPTLLGYERSAGPWLLSQLARSFAGEVRWVPWEAIGKIDPDHHTVRLTCALSEVELYRGRDQH